MDITRPRSDKEVLHILPCPFCGGGIHAGDCGYSTFNPGWAKCCGTCKREWKLGMVDNAWDAGKKWNRLQPLAMQIDDLKTKLANLRREAGL